MGNIGLITLVDKLLNASSLIELYEGLQKEAEEVFTEGDEIQNIINKYKDNFISIQKYNQVERVSDLIEEFISLTNSINEDNGRIEKLNEYSVAYAYNNDIIKEVQTETEELKKQLPDLCPICGGDLDVSKL